MKVSKHVGSLFITIATLFMVGDFPSWARINDGLVAYYPFNGNAQDASGNGHNGTVYRDGSTTDKLGHPNGALDFNGADSYVQLPILSSYFMSDFSISAWVLFRDFNRYYPHILCGENNYVTFHGLGPVYGDDAQKVAFYQESHTTIPSDRIVPQISTSYLNVGVFYHVAVVKRPDTASIYLNGQLQSSISTNIAGYPMLNGNFVLAGTGFMFHSDEYLNGKIDDVRIYNRALSEAEVKEIYKTELDCNNFPEEDVIIPTDFSTDTRTINIKGEDNKDDFVLEIDNFEGVSAYLNAKNNGYYGNGTSYYQCTEYAARYLSSKFSTEYRDSKYIGNADTQGFKGKDFSPQYGGTPTVGKDDGKKIKPLVYHKTPLPGDIAMFATIGHTAVVKCVGSKVTLIEQNFLNSSQTHYKKNRKISTSAATFYRFPATTISGKFGTLPFFEEYGYEVKS